jgi:purine nucleosidase
LIQSRSGWFLLILFSLVVHLQAQRYVIADQDAAGPGGSDMTSLLVLLQSPDVKVLGITVVTGDGWRDPEVAHALRMLEIIGRTDVAVYPGAMGPLLRTQEWTALADQMYGQPTYLGAWSSKPSDDPSPEGKPISKPADEDAAHFMIRMVHQYPHQVTIYAGGPLTNVALAVSLDQHFAELSQQLVVMGGSIEPQTDKAEWYSDPRHEFNFWFDPEAASIVLKAKWPRISVTTIDASLKTRLEPEVLDGLVNSKAVAAQYLVKYTKRPVSINYLWDELAAAAWLDPTIITRERFLYMDVDTNHGPTYGDTLTYTDQTRPKITLQKVHAQMDVDLAKLQHLLIHLLSSETPNAVTPPGR